MPAKVSGIFRGDDSSRLGAEAPSNIGSAYAGLKACSTHYLLHPWPAPPITNSSQIFQLAIAVLNLGHEIGLHARRQVGVEERITGHICRECLSEMQSDCHRRSWIAQ